MTNYKQYDTRWATLGYPRKPWLIRNCGCGEVAICNAITGMLKYAGETPKTIQPYMVQFAESSGNGTYHYGIPTAMKHYGMTEVYEHATMQNLFAELAKGSRIAILLMGSRNAGSKGVHWTGSGHFVAAIAYKKEGGKNWMYIVDSASTSSLRNGWITYEDNVRGACLKCWSGKLNKDNKLDVDGIGGPATVTRLQEFLGVAKTGGITVSEGNHKYCEALVAVEYGEEASATVKAMQRWLGISQSGKWEKTTSAALQKRLNIEVDGYFGTKSMKSLQRYLNMRDKAVYPTPKPEQKTIWDNANAYARKIAADDSYHYVPYSSEYYTHKCPICTGRTYDKGWNCIGFAWSVWRHGAGIPCRCNCEVINDPTADKILRSNHQTAEEIVKSKTGLTQVTVISAGGKTIPLSSLRPGDIVLLYDGKTYYHTEYYMGSGLFADSTRGRSDQIKAGVPMSKEMQADIKIAIRYTGKIVL